MSGAEVLGLLSGILTVIEASIKISQAVNDASGLPENFRNVVSRLPLVHDTLTTLLEEEEEQQQQRAAAAAAAKLVPTTKTKNGFKEDDDDDDDYDNDLPQTLSSASSIATAAVLESCGDKATSLNELLQTMIPSSGAPRRERYYKALKTLPKGEKVEGLMEGILKDLQVVTSSRAVKAATREQVDRLILEVRRGNKNKKGVRGGRGAEGGGGGVMMYNTGIGGSQYVFAPPTGQGNQNVNTGSGVQFNGSCSGPIYFGR